MVTVEIPKMPKIRMVPPAGNGGVDFDSLTIRFCLVLLFHDMVITNFGVFALFCVATGAMA